MKSKKKIELKKNYKIVEREREKERDARGYIAYIYIHKYVYTHTEVSPGGLQTPRRRRSVCGVGELSRAGRVEGVAAGSGSGEPLPAAKIDFRLASLCGLARRQSRRTLSLACTNLHRGLTTITVLYTIQRSRSFCAKK